MAFLSFVMMNAVILFPIIVNMLRKLYEGPIKDSCRVNEEDRATRNDEASEVDMISNLPGPILDNIFQYLPFQDIVRTSVLSRQWRYKWVTCPKIVLELDPFFVEHHDVEAVLSNILRLHQGPLTKFVLDTPFFQSSPELNQWIHVLPTHTLQEFTLYIQDGDGDGDTRHQLGSHLSSFQNLRKLKLDICAFDPPSQGFKNLVNLHLTCVDLVTHNFGDFLASCPALAVLEMESCSDFDCLRIAGPQLKSFMFGGLFHSISFKNCPILRAVGLYLREDIGFSFDSVKALATLPALEDLKLQAFVLLDLVRYGAPNKLIVALKSLKKLKLTAVNFRTIEEISSVLCFIRSCPNLEILDIISFPLEAEDVVTGFLRSLKPSGSFTKLKSVVIRYFTGYDPQMEFVKLLLASSPLLEEMVITPPWNKSMDQVASVLDKLIEFEMASSMVKLIARSY